jgi:solute carrier family 35 protein E3
MTSKYESYFNALWLVTNVAAVVGIVTANKLVFSHFKFHFGTLLTVIHFTFTSLCLELGKTFGLIERKSGVKWWKVLPLSTAFCGFVVLTNLSLQYNSVGFYQVRLSS